MPARDIVAVRMKFRAPHTGQHPLLGQLGWFTRLRWLAGAFVFCAAVLDRKFLHWYPQDGLILSIGVAILLYNLAFWIWLNRLAKEAARKVPRSSLLILSWVQLALDISSLTILTVLTGGLNSPLLGLFVLHMVFASLLLSRAMAWGGAVATLLLLVAGLIVSNQMPADTNQWLRLAGFAVSLLATVLLATHITRALRNQGKRLSRQNRRIMKMSRQLRRQQRAIMQSEKMSALGQMAAGVAHEIANPLAAMDSVVQLMQRKPEKLKVESLGTVREQIDRINTIIRELTLFARPADAQWQHGTLNDVVAESVKLLSFDKRMREVNIEQQLSNDVGQVPMLRQALEQVLLNLLRNALDAMDESRVRRLTIRTLRDNQHAIIEVSDTGHGIDNKNLRRLFEPFFTTKPVGKGTGLGLSISYALVQKHRGTISVRSKPAEGTTFVIRLPIKTTAMVAQPTQG